MINELLNDYIVDEFCKKLKIKKIIDSDGIDNYSI